MIYDVVNASIRPLLNPDLTASWEKGLTYVAEGSITTEEYMVKLENFIKRRTDVVEFKKSICPARFFLTMQSHIIKRKDERKRERQ